ncbi:hypothetical protein L1887_19055 [Cichorium endivia]|nr:hypothetical protein L1887_19055 [Cichorium endivia]
MPERIRRQMQEVAITLQPKLWFLSAMKSHPINTSINIAYERGFRREVFVRVDSCRSEWEKEAQGSDIGSNFGTLLENMDGCEFFFKVGGEKFHAHMLVLAARSRVFWAKFYEQEGDHDEVVITDMEPKVF